MDVILVIGGESSRKQTTSKTTKYSHKERKKKMGHGCIMSTLMLRFITFFRSRKLHDDRTNREKQEKRFGADGWMTGWEEERERDGCIRLQRLNQFFPLQSSIFSFGFHVRFLTLLFPSASCANSSSSSCIKMVFILLLLRFRDPPILTCCSASLCIIAVKSIFSFSNFVCNVNSCARNNCVWVSFVICSDCNSDNFVSTPLWNEKSFCFMVNF